MKSSRNRTLTLSSEELEYFSSQLLSLSQPVKIEEITNKIICQDFSSCVDFLPRSFVDLLILDPPYNLTKDYNGNVFKSKNDDEYKSWFNKVIISILPLLNKNATVYVCSDWKTSVIISPILSQYFDVLNRITWEREKGRGAKRNWKNNTEDIWFCVNKGGYYYFDVDAVKIKRKVIAPYRDECGNEKDWKQEGDEKYRFTCPSNIWTDITVPFWSMPENTDHPTQKPEKLIAKLMLASSKLDDFILDPFAGSGTTAVVAKKLGRKYLGIEINKEYSCCGLKRLAEENNKIQGYSNGVFLDRNAH